ncbi:transcription initiation factor TFIID subunit A-domain-containing protein [Infundibulicybe gibba]|nr:transcription initiation factor TFIID subunit A-domain-containing protein [Infundibulicybe gibba]
MDQNPQAGSSSNPPPAPNPNGGGNGAPPDASSADTVIGALNILLKSQTGENLTNERMAHLLLNNMAHLVKQGKLNQAQIMQLKQFADKHHKLPQGANTAAGPSKPNASASSTPGSTPAAPSAPVPLAPAPAAVATPASNSTHPALKPGMAEPGAQTPSLSLSTPTEFYPPISQTLSNVTNPGPVPWPAARPTLTGGIPSGRMSGTPAQIARHGGEEGLEDLRGRSGTGAGAARKGGAGGESMRRTIQDLVASVDPNVRIEPEVEDLLLSIADEFIDSVSNFACRLAKHRGGDTLEVKDLQLHLERNHNIRIPGFASDETRISLSQSSVAPLVPPGGAAGKKALQGTQMTLRSQRLAQVAQAKREGKLM